MTGWENVRFRALAVLIAVASAALAVGCRAGSDPNPHAGGPQAIPVKVQTAHNIPVNDATEYVATLKSRSSAIIMPQVEGYIRQIYVHSGDRVETGTALIEIDPLKQEATVISQRSNRAAQEANLKWAQQEYERTSGLYAAGVVSKQELDRTKSALEDRKVIDRAKGILMKLKGLNEDEAYVLLRSTAMREKKKISEIAQSILTASEMLK